MNVEQAYIKYNDTEKVITIVKQRLNGKLPNIALDEQLSDFDSYNAMLADNLKRKAAPSPLSGHLAPNFHN